jgi:hypothetical protein
MRAPKTYEDEVNAYAAYQRAVENAAGGPVEGDRWGVSEGVRTGRDKVRRRTADVLAVEEYRLPDGRTVTRRVLAPGFQGDEITRMGQAGGSTFAAEQSRLDLATRLREALAEGSELARDRGGRSVPVESLLDELAEFTGMAGRQIDPGVAQRAADYALDLNLPMDRAMRLATVEASGIPSAVRRVFYEEGFGDLIEQRLYEPQSTAVLNRDSRSGIANDSPAWLGTPSREGMRTLRGDERRSAATVLDKGRKMGPGKGRNKLDAEAFTPNRVSETPWVPVLVARRTEERERGGPIAPTVQQPKYDQELQGDIEAAWRLAAAGDPEGIAALEQLRVPEVERMQLNARGNAERARAYDPSALRMLTLNPLAVLDPQSLRSVAAEGQALERIKALARLVEDYARPVPLTEKSQTGSYEPVGIPGRERNPLDPDGPVPGLARLQDPGVVMTSEVKYPTLGKLVSQIMERHRTPMHLMALGDGEEPYLVEARGTVLDDGRVVDGRLPANLGPYEQVAQLLTPRGAQLRAITRHSDGSATIGPEVFPQGRDVQRVDTGALVNPFRVGSRTKVTDKALEEFGALLNGLMAAQGLDGDWQMVGDSWVADPVTYAAQNEMLREVFGDEMVAGASRFQGEFPGQVTRAGRDWTPLRNPMMGVMGLMEALSRAVVEDDARIDGRPAMAPGEPGYQELWSDVAQPQLEETRRTLQERAASAPGMRASDVPGRVFPGVRTQPQADRPGILPTNAVVNRAPLPEGIDMATLQRVLARPDLADRGTLATIQDWIDQNYQSPTRSTPEPGAAYPSAAPARTPVDLASALASNAASTEEPRLRAVPDYGALIAQAQAGRQQRLAEEAAGGGEERTRRALAKARILGLLR